MPFEDPQQRWLLTVGVPPVVLWPQGGSGQVGLVKGARREAEDQSHSQEWAARSTCPTPLLRSAPQAVPRPAGTKRQGLVLRGRACGRGGAGPQ